MGFHKGQRWLQSCLQFTSMISEGVNSYMSLFADDAKLLKKVGSEEDSQPLQQDLDMI